MQDNIVIGFDAKRAAQNNTGLGNYSRFIIGAVSSALPNATLNLYTPSAKESRMFNRVDELRNTKVVYPEGSWKRFPSLWRTIEMGKAASRDGVQIFHGLSAELPYRVDKIKPRMKTIVTVHDLIYKRYPELYGTIDRQIYFSKLKYACKVADRIIATSACTMRDIVNYCGVTSEKIDVVYQGVSQAYYNVPTALEKEFVRNTYGLPESFILYVGTIEQRKNLMVLAQALRLLPESVSVVAIGRRTPYAEEVERYVERGGVSKRFKMLEGVPFRHLPTIYKMASLFVYPSRFEGFGIPIVEALVSGVPVIACTGSCLEEAGGPASIYVSPDDPSGLAKQIETLMNHPDRRNEMIKAGRDYAIRFTPTAIADALLKVYDNVLRF